MAALWSMSAQPRLFEQCNELPHEVIRFVNLHLDLSPISHSIIQRSCVWSTHAQSLWFYRQVMKEVEDDRMEVDSGGLDDAVVDHLDSAITSCISILDTLLQRDSVDIERQISTTVVSLISHVTMKAFPTYLTLVNPTIVSPRHPIYAPNPVQKFVDPRATISLLLLGRSRGKLREVHDASDRSVKLTNSKNASISTQDHRRFTASEFVLGRFHSDASSMMRSEQMSAGIGDQSSVLSLRGDHEEGSNSWDPRLDAHVLANSAADSPIWLSLLCVGTSDTIWVAMASTLYQHTFLRKSSPVYGLLLDPHEASVSLVVGWLSNPRYPGDLPPVSISQSLSTLMLSSPSDMLIFLRILLGFKSYFASLITDTPGFPSHFYCKPLEWRSDGPCHIPVETVALERRIEKWYKGLDIMHPGDEPQETSRINANKRDASNAYASSSIPSIVLPESDELESSKAFSQSSAGPKRFSSSEFAAAAGGDMYGGLKGGYMAAWLASRFVYPAAFPGMAQMKDHPIYALATYYKYTVYYPLDCVLRQDIQVDASVQDIYKDLKNAIQQRNALPDLVSADPGALPEVIERALVENLSSLLRISYDATAIKAQSIVEKIPEAEARLQWDRLFMQAASIQQGVDYKFERRINYALNDDHKASGDTALQNAYLRVTDKWSLEDFEPGGPQIYDGWFQTEESAYDYARRWRDILKTSRQSGRASIKRPLAVDEPRRGKVDSMLTVQIHGLNLKSATFITNPDTPSKARTRGIDDALPKMGYPGGNPTDLIATSYHELASRRKLLGGMHKDAVDKAVAKRKEAISVEATATAPRPTVQSIRPSKLPPCEKSTHPAANASRNRTKAIVESEEHLLEPPSSDRVSEGDFSAWLAEIQGSLFLPLITGEHKNFVVDERFTGINQGRMHGTSAVKLLATLGIFDFPVFTLIGEGTCGIVTCAYCTEEEVTVIGQDQVRSSVKVHKVKLHERYAVGFDIADSLDVFRFFVFVAWLAVDHSANLRKLVQARRGDLEVQVELLHWNMSQEISRAATAKKEVEQVADALKRGAAYGEDVPMEVEYPATATVIRSAFPSL